MLKLSSAIPKYRKHRASGQAIVSINGRVHYLGLHGSRASKLEYDRLVNQWLASGRNPLFGLPENLVECPKLSEIINAYRREPRGTQRFARMVICEGSLGGHSFSPEW